MYVYMFEIREHQWGQVKGAGCMCYHVSVHSADNSQSSNVRALLLLYLLSY